jgi:hypothetical protein
MHSPMRTKQDNLTVWKEFEALVEEGKVGRTLSLCLATILGSPLDSTQVRQLGISNIYDPDLLRWAFETFEIKPSVV